MVSEENKAREGRYSVAYDILMGIHVYVEAVSLG